MEMSKKELLMQQIENLSNVINNLSNNFDNEDIADELNYLDIVRNNLKQWVEKS